MKGANVVNVKTLIEERVKNLCNAFFKKPRDVFFEELAFCHGFTPNLTFNLRRLSDDVLIRVVKKVVKNAYKKVAQSFFSQDPTQLKKLLTSKSRRLEDVASDALFFLENGITLVVFKLLGLGYDEKKIVSHVDLVLDSYCQFFYEVALALRCRSNARRKDNVAWQFYAFSYFLSHYFPKTETDLEKIRFFLESAKEVYVKSCEVQRSSAVDFWLTRRVVKEVVNSLESFFLSTVLTAPSSLWPLVFKSFEEAYDFKKPADLDDVLTYYVFCAAGLQDSWKYLQELVRKKTQWPSVASWFKVSNSSASSCFYVACKLFKYLANADFESSARVFEAMGKCLRPYVEELIRFFEKAKGLVAYEYEARQLPQSSTPCLRLLQPPDESSNFFSALVRGTQLALEEGKGCVEDLVSKFEDSSRCLNLTFSLLKKDVLSFLDEYDEELVFYGKFAVLSTFATLVTQAVLDVNENESSLLLSKVFQIASSVGESRERAVSWFLSNVKGGDRRFNLTNLKNKVAKASQSKLAKNPHVLCATLVEAFKKLIERASRFTYANCVKAVEKSKVEAREKLQKTIKERTFAL